MKSRFVILLFLLLSLFCNLVLWNTRAETAPEVHQWDKSGYHLFLPAVFIYQDISHLSFYSYIDSVYQPTGVYKNYEITPLENGNRINKYTVGVAVHEAPFFLAAHVVNAVFLDYPKDGYSLPYQYGTIISTLFWVVAGLFLLRRFLLYHFSDGIAAAGLLLIAAGTNLYHYTVFSPGMAHTYSFFHFAAIMLLTHLLYTGPPKKYFYLLGIVLGLTVITRSSNLVIIIIPLLWGVYNKATLYGRLVFIKHHAKYIVLAVIIFFITVFPQLLYWKYVSGQWFADTYRNEGFIWTEPKIWQGLFGFQKGWFIYTPIAAFAIMGIYSMRKSFRQHIPAIALLITINIYVIFSWWNWWYGGGFGCRPLIESMAVLALPLCAFISNIRASTPHIKTSIFALMFALVPLNIFQSYQQWKNVIHWDKMTSAYYFRVFLKTQASDADKTYLMTEEAFLEEYNSRRSKVINKQSN